MGFREKLGWALDQSGPVIALVSLGFLVGMLFPTGLRVLAVMGIHVFSIWYFWPGRRKI